MTYYVTTSIPYVNARPHLGFALELVQADVLARHRRSRGVAVRFLSGTDENSLKNVLAAEAEGVGVQELVDRNAAAFAELAEPLALSFDDFIRTSRDPRHREGVAHLWKRCAEAGDFYRRTYTGLYCVGCEAFYTESELVEGRCPDHGTEPQQVSEENWFFRLSKYEQRLRELITSGALRIEPVSRRNEVLALIDSGLRDFSVSRSRARARGWGIPVPGDEDQVVYVWWDALGNYVTSLGLGGEQPAEEFERWWAGDGERVHLLGKGVLRFHAVYWPAMLLSAGLPLPTRVLVHDYLTVSGRKISKSSGDVVDPSELVARYGTDAVRWWLLREVPRVGDADFTEERLIARADADLADGFGNLVHRVVTMVHRYRDGVVPQATAPTTATSELRAVCARAAGRVDAALDDFDYRAAAAAVWTLVEEANRCIDRTRPWELAKLERAGAARAGAGAGAGAGSEGGGARSPQLDAALAALVAACRELGEELRPFLPDAAERIVARCIPVGGRLPESTPLFAKLQERQAVQSVEAAQAAQ